MPILKLIAELGLNKTGFDAAMASADKSVAKFGAGFKNQLAGAFGATAIIAFTKSIIDMGSDIQDAADRLGIGTDEIQDFTRAARNAGGDMSTFASAIEKIRVTMSTGDNPLAAFGITMQDLQSSDAAGVLRKLAVALKDFNGSAEQTKALREVFGKGAGGTVAMLRNLGTPGGSKLTDLQVAQLDAASERLNDVWLRLKVMGASLLTGPALVKGENGWEFQREGAVRDKAGPSAAEIDDQIRRSEEQAASKERIAKIEAETQQVMERNRFNALSKEEQLVDLKERQVELERELAFQLTPETIANKQLEIAKNQAAMIGAENRLKRDSSNIEESASGRSGIFTGAAAEQSSGQARVESALNKIHTALLHKGIIVRDARR